MKTASLGRSTVERTHRRRRCTTAALVLAIAATMPLAAAAPLPVGWTGPVPARTATEEWALGEVTHHVGTVQQPWNLVRAGDGAMWMLTWSRSVGGAVVRVPIGGEPAIVPTEVSVDRLVPGPAGDVWAIAGATHLVRLQPDGTSEPLDAGLTARPAWLEASPDGGAWFGGAGADHVVGHIAPDGTVTTFPISPGAVGGVTPAADGSAWAVEAMPPAGVDPPVGGLVRFRRDGTAQRFPLDGVPTVRRLAPTPAGAWFSSSTCTTCPATLHHQALAGTLTTFDDLTLPSLSHLVAEPGGSVLVLPRQGDSSTWTIARVTTDGAVEAGDAFDGPPSQLQRGPDGALWFMTTGSAGEAGDVVRVDDDLVVETVMEGSADVAALGEWYADLEVGSDGLWWALFTPGGTLVHRRPSGEVVSYGGLALPRHLTTTADGSVWTHATATGDLVAVRPDDHLQAVGLGVTTIGDLITGPDGRVWFTDPTTDRIGAVDAAGATTWVEDPAIEAPTALAAGVDGEVWFANGGTAPLGIVSSAGEVSLHDDPAIPGPPSHLTVAPEGDLWFAVPGAGGGTVGRRSPDGVVATFPHGPLTSDRGELVHGPDGNVWLLTRHHLARITPAGAITTFALPDETFGVNGAVDLVTGVDGNLWFTYLRDAWDGGTSYIGRMTPAGDLTTFPAPMPWSYDASSLAVDAAGNLWTTEEDREEVARIELRCDPAPFPDVATSNPFCADVRWLAWRGITTGFADGTFRPGAPIERQAVAAFLHRQAGSPEPDPGPPAFADVGPDHPFFDAIQWMAQQGITTGTPTPGGPPSFEPGERLSRQALAAFLHRQAGAPEPDPGPPAFADVGPDHPFFDAIQWMAQQEISTGTPTPGGPPRFEPGASVSRQALAAFLHRLVPRGR